MATKTTETEPGSAIAPTLLCALGVGLLVGDARGWFSGLGAALALAGGLALAVWWWRERSALHLASRSLEVER